MRDRAASRLWLGREASDPARPTMGQCAHSPALTCCRAARIDSGDRRTPGLTPGCRRQSSSSTPGIVGRRDGCQSRTHGAPPARGGVRLRRHPALREPPPVGSGSPGDETDIGRTGRPRRDSSSHPSSRSPTGRGHSGRDGLRAMPAGSVGCAIRSLRPASGSRPAARAGRCRYSSAPVHRGSRQGADQAAPPAAPRTLSAHHDPQLGHHRVIAGTGHVSRRNSPSSASLKPPSATAPMPRSELPRLRLTLPGRG